MTPYLKELENESIYIIREAYASFKNLAMLYSIGKDSSVLLHLVRKAFYPNTIPFPLLHVDTTWKFNEMIEFRDMIVKKHSLDLRVYSNPSGKENNITPFSVGSSRYTDIMKTQALRQALDLYSFDATIGGARRDEEKSRAKERIFSVRTNHRWEPRAQRQELWNNYNTHLAHNETMRVFPLSNWTELDVWEYIREEYIEIVPLYYAKKRPVVFHANTWLMIDDIAKLPPDFFDKNSKIEERLVRFRTLGCWPLSGCFDSSASNLDEIIEELKATRYSERQGRLIDSDQVGSMEKKKQEGYF